MWDHLTERQREVILIICRLHYERGRPQAIRTIQAALGIRSPNGIMCHIKALAKKGWVVPIDSGLQHRWNVVVAPPGWVLLPGGGIVPTQEVPRLVATLLDQLKVLRPEAASA